MRQVLKILGSDFHAAQSKCCLLNKIQATQLKSNYSFQKFYFQKEAATLSGVRVKCELFGRSHNRVWHPGIVNIFSTTLCKQAT